MVLTSPANATVGLHGDAAEQSAPRAERQTRGVWTFMATVFRVVFIGVGNLKQFDPFQQLMLFPYSSSPAPPTLRMRSLQVFRAKGANTHYSVKFYYWYYPFLFKLVHFMFHVNLFNQRNNIKNIYSVSSHAGQYHFEQSKQSFDINVHVYSSDCFQHGALHFLLVVAGWEVQTHDTNFRRGMETTASGCLKPP